MGKGSGGGSTPKLLDDNLKNKQFLNIVDLIGEGQIEGPVGGLHGFRINGTPVVDKGGNPNIHGVTVQWRAGTQSQEPLTDHPFVESEIPVSVEVKKDSPILRAVSGRDVDRVRLTVGVSQLVQTDSKGNQSNTSVQLAIDVNDGSGWYNAKIVHIGPAKISGQYLESHTIDAPKKKPFQIRVSRLTDDSKSDQLRNGTVWASYTEITDTLMSYPNSAVVGMRIDRSLFADTPKRTYHIKGMIIQVPDNYDPETREYHGVWTGRFKPAYTNNPAWIFYDLVTNTRYGIGKLMGSFGCDKFALYAIAQYCDQIVPDGFGGTEPRFTCNAYITTQRKARDVLDDLASVFRGMQVWNGLQLTCFQDRPSDPVWTFTNANVVEGKFNYGASAKKARHTVIEVTWMNPDNGWKEEPELIQDDALVDRLGLNVKKVTAFGCTSRGQAHRVGRWIIETEKLETDSVTFSTGREGINCIPGDIVEIADNSFAAARIGGRVLTFSGKEVRLDAPADFAQGESGYFSYMGNDGKFIRVDIESVSGDVITLKDVPAGLRQWGVFSISKRSLVTRLFRVMSIAEDTKSGHYNFTCIQHEPQKEAIVDNGVDFQGMPATQNVIRIPNIERLSMAYIQDSAQVQARAMWATTTINRNITFEVVIYRDNKVVSRGNTKDLEYYISGLDVGIYQVGVRARDDNGMLGDESKVQMVIGAPAAPSVIDIEPGFFELKAIPHISAPKTLDTQFEFWFSATRISNINEVEVRADFLGIAKFWTKGQLKAGTSYWFYVRSVNEFGKSHFVEAEGRADDNAKNILEIVGNQFLSTEAGKRLAEKIDFNTEKTTELERSAHELGSKALNLEQQIGDVAEEMLSNAHFSTQLSHNIQEEVHDRKADISRLEQVQANEREAHTKFQSQISSEVSNNRAAVLDIRESQSTQEKAFVKAVDQVKASLKTTDDSVQDITGRVTQNTNAIAAANVSQAKFEQTTRARFEEQSSDISKMEKTVTDAESALSEALMQTSAQFNAISDQQFKSAARIVRVEKAVATEKIARAEMGQQIHARLNDAESAIVDVKKTQTEADKAWVESQTQLRAEIQKGDTQLQESIDQQARQLSAINSTFNEQKTAIANLENSSATLEQAQKSQYEAQQSQITHLNDTFSNQERSQAESILQLAAQAVDAAGEQRQIRAEINRVDKARADDRQAFANSIETLKAQVGENSAVLEEKATAVFDIDGNGYAIKDIGAGVNYKGQFYKAGMVIGAEVKNGQVETQFGVRANQFTVVNPTNGKLEPVFTIKDGQVFIKEGFIDLATIQHLLVGMDIKSTNYIPNQRGFRFDAKTGAIEINGVSNEYRIMISNRGFYLFDKTNTPIIELGELL
ncbi:Host specificity protein J (modular protein) [Xenorhabdus poinarii G6]|uniref:Host specificity protein J (Modular protein) n=1 Tax=Xenorhabdus poinarii G6 TaxID=1354304 RepID=A0A068QY83_9GAMM|nr:phage tail protein [Xenorhabdus poinarii]CDG20017.1 Host specificity protein J (modular protein) [Xenorhabdus poinarii G6]